MTDDELFKEVVEALRDALAIMREPGETLAQAGRLNWARKKAETALAKVDAHSDEEM